MVAEGANWELDKEHGEDFEQRVVKMLAGKYHLRKVEGNHPEYDLICDKTGTTIECKSDRVMHKSGNIVIEEKALDKCIAELFLYEDFENKKIYWARWDDLRYWVKLAVEIGDYVSRPVGENRTMGYIIPLGHTIAYMKEWK